MPKDPRPASDPKPGKGASEPDSSKEPATSSAPSLIDDPGPRFDPEASPAGPVDPQPSAPAGPDVLEKAIEWEKDVVADILEGKGELLHAWRGIAEADWAYTQDEIRKITPPLVRLLNRYVPELAEYADPAVLGALFMKWATRSLRERRSVLEGIEPPPAPKPAAAPAPAPATSTADPGDTSEAEPAPGETAGPEVDPEVAAAQALAVERQAKLDAEELEKLDWQRPA